MPENPFPLLKTWQAQKKEFGIPGKVIKKGAFGDQLDKLAKKFNSEGGRYIDAEHTDSVDEVLKVLQTGQTLVDEWLTKAKSMKSTEFKNKAGAIAAVEKYKENLTATVNRVDVVTDPMHDPRINHTRAIKRYQVALTDPSNSAKLTDLWDNGLRQDIGQGFKLAVKHADTFGYTSAVVSQLQKYDKVVAKWIKMLDGNFAGKVAADPEVRDTFLNDMEKALSIASAVLKAVTPVKR